MKPQTYVTLYNHDYQTTINITLARFIKLFNDEQIDGTNYTIVSITNSTSARKDKVRGEKQ